MLFTILCGLAALSIGYFINYFTKGHFVHSTEAVLEAEMRYIDTIGADNIKETGQLYVFLKSDGTLPDEIPTDISKLAEGILVFDHAPSQKRYAAKIHTLKDGRKILIGTDITQISKDFKFMQYIGVASIFFVMAVVFVSYIISIFVVSGTNKIANTAREIIETGDLSRRVQIGAQWDDLSNMAIVLNMLLDRVEELMQGVRQVSDNIAHDLRTPLTRMRGHIENLKDGAGKERLLNEADHILNTFNALLRISRLESEKKRSHFRNLNLKEIIEDVAAFYEPLAEEKSIMLSSKLEDAEINGDRDILFQAYANILDNAIKFTPPNGKVSIELQNEQSGEKNRITAKISDTGAGITNADKNKIFDRFYRGEKSRTSAGTGLGLSLVKAVIDLHGGKIEIKDNAPGLTIITII